MAELTMLDIPTSLKKSNDDRVAPSKSSGEPLQISLTDIAPDPDQPRKQFDQKIIDTMAAQFLDPDVGQIEAIFARANPAGSPPYLIVHGETRYKAALQAGLTSLRAIITKDTGFIRQLLSNETRGDLTLLDKANAYQQLIDQYQFNQKTIAELLGKNTAHVSMHLALLDMPILVQRAYDHGKATTVRVLDDLRKLVTKHTGKKAQSAIELFINGTEVISRSNIAELDKKLSKQKPKAKSKTSIKENRPAPQIDGKAFQVVSVENDVISVKLSGEKKPKQYRLIPVE